MKIKPGSRGEAVADIQRRLLKLGYELGITTADGVFGPLTTKAIEDFQEKNGLQKKGWVDKATWQRLVEETYELGDRTLYLHQPFFRGKDVKELQIALRGLGFNPGKVDAIFGPKTDRAVKEFQRSVGLSADGVVGFSTINEMKKFSQGEPSHNIKFPSREVKKPFPKGFTVILDFIPSSEKTNDEGLTSLKESKLVNDLEKRLANLLAAWDVKSFSTTEKRQQLSEEERVEKANQLSGDVLISLQLNSSNQPEKSGTETFYFTEGESPSLSCQLAEVLQKEITKTLGTQDLGTKKQNLLILTKTKMPSVLIKPFFITNPEERALFEDETTRQRLATALLEGLKKLAQEFA